MFRKLPINILIVLSMSLLGCGVLRQTKLDLVAEHIKNVETCKEVTRQLIDVWLFSSGKIRKAVRTEQLSVETLADMDKCDELAAKEELTDFELGTFAGCLIRITNSVSTQIIQQYAPEFLDALPFVL